MWFPLFQRKQEPIRTVGDAFTAAELQTLQQIIGTPKSPGPMRDFFEKFARLNVREEEASIRSAVAANDPHRAARCVGRAEAYDSILHGMDSLLRAKRE